MRHPETHCIDRPTYRVITPQSNVSPTDRELRWLKHIERHGPQSSKYLHDLTRDTHRCKDTALRQMQKLRAGGYLTLPPQQRHTAKADFNPYIYDVTQKARDHLRELGLAEPTIRPSGHWWHSYAVSCVTSSIDIAAGRDDVQFIPAHEILAIRNASFAIPIGRRRLIPDQLFALDYGGRYRAFALEVDRGNEPKVSRAARKSWSSSIELYRQMIDRQLWKPHYGLSTNLLVLWVCSSNRHADALLNMVASNATSIASSVLVQHRGVNNTDLVGFGPSDDLYSEPWQRARGPSVVLAAPKPN